MGELKMYWLSTPWDYHGQAGVVILTTSKEDAAIKWQDTKAHRKSSSSYYSDYGDFEDGEFELIENDIYLNGGCDC